MNRRRCLLVPVLLMVPLLLCGCEGLTVAVDATDFRVYEPAPPPGVRAKPVRHAPNPYGHLPQRTSFSPMSSVELKEGCYEGDFTLGRSQIEVVGAGVGKTVIHGNLVLQTQCVVSNLTVTGDVIFEGNQAELVDADFFGRIVDNGVQNTY